MIRKWVNHKIREQEELLRNMSTHPKKSLTYALSDLVYCINDLKIKLVLAVFAGYRS